MWDEISITKDMRFDTRSLKWKGIVDYAGETTIMVPNGLADHVLMFVFRPFLQGWIQPFAWFGTKGGAPGAVLLELVTKSIVRLFNAGAIVKACVCDGFSTNKSLYTSFGISGTEHGCTSMSHPLDDSVRIHCLIDVPHLLKCTQNHMIKHKKVQFQHGIKG
ncbi:Cell division protein ftsj [Daphnia magna]|uniref:Cell division protein ftsj n=1 Tax=Daphnia magna TaxID=35525 RepID=A0A162CYG7_9CRUS|nr:Cell division protein ftsj [Daphnia magna]